MVRERTKVLVLVLARVPMPHVLAWAQISKHQSAVMARSSQASAYDAELEMLGTGRDERKVM